MAARTRPLGRSGPTALRRNSVLSRAGRLAVEYGPALLLLAGIVAFWELWVRIRDVQPYVLAKPSDIWDAFLEIRGTLPRHTRATMFEALAGLAAAIAVAIPLALTI